MTPPPSSGLPASGPDVSLAGHRRLRPVRVRRFRDLRAPSGAVRIRSRSHHLTWRRELRHRAAPGAAARSRGPAWHRYAVPEATTEGFFFFFPKLTLRYLKTHFSFTVRWVLTNHYVGITASQQRHRKFSWPPSCFRTPRANPHAARATEPPGVAAR